MLNVIGGAVLALIGVACGLIFTNPKLGYYELAEEEEES